MGSTHTDCDTGKIDFYPGLQFGPVCEGGVRGTLEGKWQYERGDRGEIVVWIWERGGSWHGVELPELEGGG